ARHAADAAQEDAGDGEREQDAAFQAVAEDELVHAEPADEDAAQARRHPFALAALADVHVVTITASPPAGAIVIVVIKIVVVVACHIRNLGRIGVPSQGATFFSAQPPGAGWPPRDRRPRAPRPLAA